VSTSPSEVEDLEPALGVPPGVSTLPDRPEHDGPMHVKQALAALQRSAERRERTHRQACAEACQSHSHSDTTGESGTDNDHDDDIADSALPQKRGASSAGYVAGAIKKHKRILIPDVEFTNLSDDKWSITRQVDGSGASPYASMLEIRTGVVHNVIHNRVGKAKLHLSYDGCASVNQLSACQCRKRCYRLLPNPDDVRAIRSQVFINCENSPAVASYLTTKLAAHGGRYSLVLPGNAAGGMQRAPVIVCRQYYARVHGVSVSCVKQAKRSAVAGTTAPPPRTEDVIRTAEKTVISHAFWSLFFEQHCQKPNDDIRLFPVDKTYQDIYAEYFTPWYDRLVRTGQYKDSDRPRYQTWRNARDNEEFQDVKNRRHHLHSRCGECARLKVLLLQSFKDGQQERNYRQQRRLHDEEVLQWRKLESTIKAAAVSSPGDHLLVMHDGTTCLGLPRLTHRTIKNLDHTRFEVTPWLAMDHSAGLKDYIYSLTSSTTKDANTLISQVHAVLRRAKSDYTHPRHKARLLTLVADSAAENKNNTLLAYCTDLVNNGWFDEIHLLFGPVGHTHNGVDASHKIHNQDVGAYVSGDLGQFVQNYVKGFNGTNSGGNQHPRASILGKTLNWTAYYAPVLRRIKGFTKSKNDPIMVRGFRIMKQADGTTDVTWKVDPALESEWRGSSGFPKTTGFHMLTSQPTGLPTEIVPPALSKSHMVKAKLLLGANMKAAMTNEGLLDCVQWNYQAQRDQAIPVHAFRENSVPPGEWGRLCEVGAIEGKRGLLRMLDTFWDTTLPDERETLWALPFSADGCHKAARQNQFHFSGDKALLEQRVLPRVRYANEPNDEGEVDHHPHARRDAGWVPDAPDAEEGVESDESNSAPEEKEGVESVEENDGGESAEETNAVEPIEVEDANNEVLPQPGEVWRFEENFKECKVNKFCVGLAETTKGPSPYIFVGKITSVNKDTKYITMTSYTCTGDSWKKECLDKAWNRPAKKVKNTSRPHYAIMAYANSLLFRGKLPKQVKTKVSQRAIVWQK